MNKDVLNVFKCQMVGLDEYKVPEINWPGDDSEVHRPQSGPGSVMGVRGSVRRIAPCPAGARGPHGTPGPGSRGPSTPHRSLFDFTLYTCFVSTLPPGESLLSRVMKLSPFTRGIVLFSHLSAAAARGVTLASIPLTLLTHLAGNDGTGVKSTQKIIEMKSN